MMLLNASLIGAAALASAGGFAPRTYPISPRPLRRMVQEAELIVTARVTDPGGEPSRRGPPRMVRLEIDGLVKGDPGTDAIEMEILPLSCPAPPRYRVGTRVLAFLDRDEGGGFSTHALSYGAKTLDEAAMAVYLERIREQLAIERIPGDAARLAAQVEWLVGCAEHPATRWEGAYELAHAGDFMSGYERDPDELPDFAAELSSEQLRRLKDALLAARGFEAGERCLGELFRDDEDPRLLAWLVERLRSVEEAEVLRSGYGSTRFLVERIARRDGRPGVRELAQAYQEQLSSSTEDPVEGPARWSIVRELLELF